MYALHKELIRSALACLLLICFEQTYLDDKINSQGFLPSKDIHPREMYKI